MSFSIDSFAHQCKDAMARSDDPQRAAHEFLKHTLNTNSCAHVMDVLTAAIPDGADIGEMIVHASPELTMLYGRAPARFESAIHNHTVFACIGQLAGEERSTIYERDGDGLRVVSTAATRAGEIVALPSDVIHSIENPGAETASALHIYGGDFGALMDQRTLWTTDGHRAVPFSFPSLLAESVQMMRSHDNDLGLKALVEAVPAARPLVDGVGPA